MKVKIFATLVFTIAGVFFLSVEAAAKRLEQFTKMYDARIEGFGVDDLEFGKTYCIDFTKNERVCKGYKSGDGGMYFIVQKESETIKTWKHPIGTGNGTGNFYVYYGDLDKDKSSELVVVSTTNVTNGRGVPTSNVYILSEPLAENSGKPLVFPVEEFGEKDNFIFDAKTGETLILATEWDSYDNLDPKRIAGTYLVGRWFRFSRGLLRPAFDKPVLARRYLFSFEAERWEALGDKEWHHRPYLWLKNKTTHKFYKEPRERYELISKKYGTIERYEEQSLFEEIDIERRFTIRLDSGEIVIVSSEDPSIQIEDEKERWQNVVSVRDFGLLPQRVSLPFEFSPLSIFEKVEGKRVKLETYKEKYGVYSQLWFLEN